MMFLSQQSALLKFLVLLQIASLCCCHSLHLAPTTKRLDCEQKPAALVYFAGMHVKAIQYAPMMQHIQAHFATQKIELHVSVLDYSIIPPFLNAERMVAQAVEELGFKPSRVILGGHSLGAILAQGVAFQNKPLYDSLWLHAGFIQDEFLVHTTTFPTLTVSGSRDGMNRLSYIANQHQHNAALPIVIVQGMNHVQFCNNFTTDHIRQHDLSATIALEQAWDRIAHASLLFYRQATVALDALVAESRAQYLEPFMRFYQEDTSGRTCTMMQEWIFEECQATTHEVKAVYYRTLRSFLKSKPQVSRTKVTNPFWTEHARNMIGTSLVPYSVMKLRCKMKTKQAVFKQRPSVIKSCRALNEATYERVLDTIPEADKVPYLQSKRSLVFGNDLVAYTGKGWSKTELKLTQTREHVQVQVPSLQTPPGNTIFSGMFYCNVMSASRMHEYILVDSQRGLL